MSLLIKSGLVVTSTGSYKSDVFVKDEKIVAIGSSLPPEYERIAEEVVDASGKYVLPGTIDPHTHMDMPFIGTKSTDDFLTGTVAAACGGITSLIDFEVLGKGITIKSAIEAKKPLAEGKAVIDYGFHPCITEANDTILEEIKDAIEVYGTPSFKLFMTYAFRADDYTLIKVLKKVKECGGLVQLHAENHSMMQIMHERFEKEGKLELYYHPMSRPNIVEEEAVQRAIYFTEFTDSQLYIVHLSSKEGLNRIIKARDKGLRVYSETCPQYLLLDDSCYKKPNWEGAKYIMSPPLRTKESNEALWNGIATGDVQTIGSDHCPFNFHGIKDMFGKDDYKKIPNGAPGVETILMLMHSEGVVKGRISLEKMVEVTSTNVARMFGMKDKGEIAVGKDADIVVFDPKQKFTISCEKLHMNVDYNPYEGMEITGMPQMVFSRGKKVAQWYKNHVEFIGKAGAGRFIKREPFKAF
jgi:dihydropyrimidinase